MDGVEESAVIGIPHKDFGEAVMALVVPKPGIKLNGQAMIDVLKSKIANFKVPKRVEILESLPRNAMGKVQKNILREQYSH
jgi:malonyl-CoA/methylmalonyl-CoA synthetase